MTLTALIALGPQTDDAPDGLAALLPVAGRPLIEHQARRAMAAGAGALLIVADSIPLALVSVADRLRRLGMPVRLALGAADAVTKAGDGPLLLIADGMLPEPGTLDRIAAAAGPTLLIAPDAPGRAEWERLDGQTRWAGVAMLPPGALREAADMPPDWDVALVLVRAQAGTAARIAMDEGAIVPVRTPQMAVTAAAALVPSGSRLERRLLVWAAEQPRLDGRSLRVSSLLLAAGGALLAGIGPVALALALLVAAPPMDRLGRKLAVMRLEAARHGRVWRQGRLVALAVAALAYGWRLSGAPGYEPALLAIAAVALPVLTRNEGRIAGLRAERWTLRPAWAPWMIAPFTLAGEGTWGLAGLAMWGALGLARLQWRALRGRAA